MTPTDINRRLALAIGYAPEDVWVCGDGNVLVWREIGDTHQLHWQVLDYRHPGTIYPIAEKYKMFPGWNTFSCKWTIFRQAPAGRNPMSIANTCPRACVALAVIEAKERGLL